MKPVLSSVLVALLVGGCGGGGDDDGADGDGGANIDGAGANADPMLIPGGGVRSGAIDGVLHVHAIDGEDDSPIGGATVYVDDLEGTTASSGLITFEDASLSGAQTITVVAGGFATSTWIGANGTNVTVPLSRPTTTTPQAHVEGTITGWDSLPSPGLGEYNLAVVLYSFTDDFGSPENTIAQPMSGGDALNLCINSPLSNPGCNWQMNTRVGPQVHFAVILRADDGGSLTDPSDDTYELLGFAMKAGQNMSSGQNLTGQALAMVDVSGCADATVTFPAAPTGAQTSRVAVPFVDMGAEGQLPMPLPTLAPGANTTKVPPLAGAFANATYNMISIAVPEGAERPFSSSFARDVSLTGTYPLPGYLAPPTGLSANSGTFAFSGANGAAAHLISFLDSGESTSWLVTILDDTETFAIPPNIPNPLPTGTVEMRATAFELPNFNPADFSLATLPADLTRVSDDNITF
jgi:hypothetical protein